MCLILLVLPQVLALSCSSYICPDASVPSKQRQNTVCDLNCMTEMCAFDSVTPQTSPCLSLCDVPCQVSVLGDGKCDSGTCYAECSTQECAWDYGDCGFCAQDCTDYLGFQDMLGDGVCQPACDYESCEFDAGDCVTEDFPFLIYVSNTTQTEENGSFRAPFSNLHEAFLSVWAPYTRIYLLVGVHSLELRSGLTDRNPLSHLPSSVLSITLTTLYCANPSTDHSECATSRAELYASRSQITLTVSSKLVVTDLVIRGDYDLLPGCWEPLCTYCPFVTETSPGVWKTDHAHTVEAGHFAPQSLCDEYRNFTLFDVKKGARLEMQKVTFQHHRQQMQALILSTCASVTLINVDFINILPLRDSSDNAAVILHHSDGNFCGNLTYRGGTVSYLNNGYEYQQDTVVTGFLHSEFYDSVLLDSILFHHNDVILGFDISTELFLLHFDDTHLVTIHNCTFQSNLLTTASLIAFHTDSPLPLLLTSTSTLLYQPETHFILTNTVFVSNYAQAGSLIQVYFFSDHRNVHISNCTFRGNVVRTAVLQLINADLLEEFTTGIWMQMVENEKVVDVFSPRRKTEMNFVVFEGNAGGINVVQAEKVGNLMWKNVSFEGNGDFPMNLNRNAEIIAEFLSNSIIYMRKIPIVFPLSPCKSLISLTDTFNFTLLDSQITSSYCPTGSGGLTFSGNSTYVTPK